MPEPKYDLTDAPETRSAAEFAEFLGISESELPNFFKEPVIKYSGFVLTRIYVSSLSNFENTAKSMWGGISTDYGISILVSKVRNVISVIVNDNN